LQYNGKCSAGSNEGDGVIEGQTRPGVFEDQSRVDQLHRLDVERLLSEVDAVKFEARQVSVTLLHSAKVLRVYVYTDGALHCERVEPFETITTRNAKNRHGGGMADCKRFGEQVGERIQLLDCG
jgi:hypothetical protein